MTKAEAVSNEHPAVGLTELNFKTRRQKLLTAPLPDPIAQSIDAIISIHCQEVQDLTAKQKAMEQM